MILRRRIMVTGGDGNKVSQYLTFRSVTNCTHKFTNTVNYSLNGGTTWQSLPANTALTVTAGNSVMWKATLTPSSRYPYKIGTFSVTDTSMRFDVEGNPMSLLYGDNFIGRTDLTGKNHAFFYLFNNNKGVVDAQNMALPATTLAESCYQNMFYNCTSLTTAPELPATTLAQYCYSGMFYNCTSLTTAPELPATTLAQYCYSGMFYNCTSLNYIKAMFTTTPSSIYTNTWVNGVAAIGTFVKNSSATWTIVGPNGVPSGWTVETASS